MQIWSNFTNTIRAKFTKWFDKAIFLVKAFKIGQFRADIKLSTQELAFTLIF